MGLFIRHLTHNHHRTGLGRLALLALTLGTLLAGCGYSTANGAGPGGDTGGSGPITGTSIRPCVGPYADVEVEGQPALTLSDTSTTTSGRAHVGDLVQIQLTGTWHWTLSSAPPQFVATQYAGAYDQARQVCFWNFRAQSAGNAKVDFTGSPRCESGQACPAIARVETFTITVS
jgi:hypothetical protein